MFPFSLMLWIQYAVKTNRERHKICLPLSHPEFFHANKINCLSVSLTLAVADNPSELD